MQTWMNSSTSSELFLSLTNFPSASISSIDTFPEDEACWTVLNPVLWALFLALIFLFFPWGSCRPWLVAGVAMLCEDGLGDNFSLEGSEIIFTCTSDVPISSHSYSPTIAKPNSFLYPSFPSSLWFYFYWQKLLSILLSLEDSPSPTVHSKLLLIRDSQLQ